MTILSQYSLEGALHFFSSQNCLKTLKEFHFGMSSELVYVLYLITVQLHLIFNQKKKKKSFLLDQPPYSSDLALGDFWLFPKMKYTLEAERFMLPKLLKKCDLNSAELKRSSRHILVLKKKIQVSLFRSPTTYIFIFSSLPLCQK